MPNPDPFMAPPVEPVIDTREFTDPLHPNDTFTFTFKVDHNGTIRQKRLMDEMALRERFLPELKTMPDKSVQLVANELFPPVRGQKVEVTAQLLQFANAFMFYDQSPEDEKWDVFKWAAFCVNYPNAWTEVSNWSYELMERYNQNEKNE